LLPSTIHFVSKGFWTTRSNKPAFIFKKFEGGVLTTPIRPRIHLDSNKQRSDCLSAGFIPKLKRTKNWLVERRIPRGLRGCRFGCSCQRFLSIPKAGGRLDQMNLFSLLDIWADTTIYTKQAYGFTSTTTKKEATEWAAVSYLTFDGRGIDCQIAGFPLAWTVVELGALVNDSFWFGRLWYYFL
jgi:hypothetical protein